MRRKKKDLEIRFYEGLLKQRPDFVQALYTLGDAYTRKGFLYEGLDVDQKLARLRPDDPYVHYNLACSLSLTGDASASLDALRKAVALGYDELSYLLKDPDLDAARRHPDFKMLYSQWKRMRTSSAQP